jgi:hypothetical protein
MKKLKVKDVTGIVSVHDLTKIVHDTYKGTVFKNGYNIKEGGIEVLKNIKKYHVNILSLNENQLYKDEVAIRIGEITSRKGIESQFFMNVK